MFDCTPPKTIDVPCGMLNLGRRLPENELQKLGYEEEAMGSSEWTCWY